MSAGGFNFQQFITDSINTVKDPKGYFTGMKKEGGLGDPIIRAVIFGAVSGLITFVLSLVGFGGLGGAVASGIVGVAAIVITPIFAIVGLFIGAIVILVMSAIGGGNTNFEANIRVCASLMVIYPLSALGNLFYTIHVYIGALIGIAISLYGLWLLYNGLVHSLKAKEMASKIMTGILAAIVVMATLGSIAAMKAAKSFGQQMEKSLGENGEFNENMGEFNKAMEEALKKMKEAQKKSE